MKRSPAIEQRGLAIRAAVLESLKDGAEMYARELLDASGLSVRVAVIQAELRAMEFEGVIAGREVKRTEHGESQYARRYYRAVDGAPVSRLAREAMELRAEVERLRAGLRLLPELERAIVAYSANFRPGEVDDVRRRYAAGDAAAIDWAHEWGAIDDEDGG